MKQSVLHRTAGRYGKSALAFVHCLSRYFVPVSVGGLLVLGLPSSVIGATVLTGDHTIEADPSATPAEAGNLTVEGELSVEGSFLDFGTTGEASPNSALSLSYEEQGSSYQFTLTAARG